MTNEKYNGWANWETWTINLYFGDDTEYHQSMAEQSEFDSAEMADLIEAWVDDYLRDTLGTSVFQGLAGEFVTAGLEQVDWHELAESWLSDCEKPLDENKSYELVEEIKESAYLWTQTENYIQEYGDLGANDIEQLCTVDWFVEINIELDNLDWELVASELNVAIEIARPESV